MNAQRYENHSLSLLQARVAGKVAEINQLLAPGVDPQISPEQLQQEAGRHMDGLSPAAQERLRKRALVAYTELQRLTAEMVQQLDLLSDEITKVTRHSRAAAAYRQAPGTIRPGFARL